MNNKSCRTCDRRNWDKCTLSGHFCDTERAYPTRCGKDYDGWVPRKGVFDRFIEAIFGVDIEESK